MISLPVLKDISDLCGKKVLLRLDFNVPIDGDTIRDDYRIRKSLPTIDFLRHAGARVIIISHIESDKQTLKPIYQYFKEKLSYPVMWCEDILECGKEEIETLKDGGVMLAENIRLYDGEKKNDPVFSKKLAALADIYVNDAFSVSHRAHASVVGVPKLLPHYAGKQLEQEVTEISKAFNPEHPFLFILGGAKFDTKLPLIQKFLGSADKIFVGGALAHNFFKEAGLELGTSLVSDGAYDTKNLLASNKIMLPSDVVATAGTQVSTVDHTKVQKDQKIVDAGKQTLAELKAEVDKAKFILFNGTLGAYEQGYVEATLELAKYIAAATKKGAHSLVGGGDTLAAIATLGIEKDFSFVSTGGGAMLDFLATETLPGIEVLLKKN